MPNNVMKKYFFILFLFICTHSFSQQKPQFTQYIFNQYLLNPALSGIENYTDFKMGHRRQWQGIKEAPETSFATINWTLGDDYLWSNPLSQFSDEDDNPMSKSYAQTYMSSPAHHGMGVTMVYDKAGPLTNIDLNLTYAYHLQLNNDLNLSLGVAGGISRTGLDINSLDFGKDYAVDPAAVKISSEVIRPNLSAGTWLYGARFFAGASIHQFVTSKMIFTQAEKISVAKSKPNYFITTGYKFYLDEEIAFMPSVMFKSINGNLNTFDLNAKLTFKDRVWLGTSYRQDDSYAAIAGFCIGKTFNISYAYDVTTSDLRVVNKGSHEIVLGILLKNIYRSNALISMW